MPTRPHMDWPQSLKPKPLRKPVKGPDLSWMEQAHCIGLTDLFYPDGADHEDRAQAKAVCAGCPIQARCLQLAMETNEPDGIWGGKSQRQRDRLRRDPIKRRMIRIAAELEAVEEMSA